MSEIVNYPDVQHYNVARVLKSKPASNLCSRYSGGRFCGNYCSRKNYPYHTRCWRHVRKYSKLLPPVILVMITKDGTIYNKRRWLQFFEECEEYGVPLQLVVYAECMYKTTVRHPWNFISRFRPFPNLYRGKTISLENAHGKMSYVQVMLDMLDYASRFEHARCCIQITETTIPIRSAKRIYQAAISYGDKCVLDPGYNVRFIDDLLPTPQRRGNHEFGLVNCRGQGLLSCKFLRESLPTVPSYVGKFGIKLNNGMYSIQNSELFDRWRHYVGGNPDEFLLLNSFLFHLYDKGQRYPIGILRSYMAKMPKHDNTVITEIAEWRDNVKRSVVFTDDDEYVRTHPADQIVREYYKNIKGSITKTKLRRVLKYLRKHKKNVLFFRAVKQGLPARV
jgi:hypothetical protein